MKNSRFSPRQPYEHDACGIGLIADLHGRRRAAIVAQGLEALAALAHRGARGADPETGDGCGLMLHLPFAFLRREIGWDESVDDVGVGMFFLPPEDEPHDACLRMIESVFEESGLRILGRRDVPVRIDVLGESARASCPAVVQIAITPATPFAADDAFERRLYLARRRIERRAEAEELDLVAVSLSCRTIVYKSMCLATRLGDFYPDLQDSDVVSGFTLFHQRFSTNTRPSWRRAQPFRLLAHNGEINTIQGNANWMRSRESELQSDLWGDDLMELFPILDEYGSDSAMLDNMLELLIRSGRDPQHAVAMLMPAAHREQSEKDPDLLAFYTFHAHFQEPWDGPAALVICDGVRAVAGLDRNGLRPLRFQRTDDVLIVGSETGIVDLAGAPIRARGRLGPGQMLMLDLPSGCFETDAVIKKRLAVRRPWRKWLDQQRVHPPAPSQAAPVPAYSDEELKRRQIAVGYSKETHERILHPMLAGKVPVASMGNDTPLAVLSAQPQRITSYFKQRFAQVTNPPIDSLRERLAFDLDTVVGGWSNLLDERPEDAHLIRFPSPVIDGEQLAWLHSLGDHGFPCRDLDAIFPTTGPEALGPAVEKLCEEAERAVDEGVQLIVISDRKIDAEHAAMPMLLAVSAVHQRLIRAQKRMRVSLVCETAEPREDHHVACLIAYGATLVYPYLVEETLLRDGPAQGVEPAEALAGYRRALEKGLLKILSRLGVCPMSSYFGAQLFEIVGLDLDVVEEFFPGTRSRVSGVGLKVLASDMLAMHAEAFADALPTKPVDRGLFRYRKDGEIHDYRPQVFKALHKAVRKESSEAFDEYARLVDRSRPTRLRDLLAIRESQTSLALDEVESVDEIVARFCGAAMSHGALSREAHEAIAVAMNRLGGRSNSGEGGEAAERLLPYGDDGRPVFPGSWRPKAGDFGNSAIKQIASGRFGVTPRYLRSARELEIKMAQGSKPGEGGQIPGHKVTVEIAGLRHATPGVTLISPPPHHDIYSIEDLAQLIHDLRRVHPAARIGVKLVSQAGVGTVAAGVAKAHADYILISGDDGGTGASPLSSIKHAGMPWELGLAETQRELVRSGLRERVGLRVDGGLKTGRDVLVGAILGAEEFGFGTAPLIALGCVMARQCHLNTCPVGIAAQRDELRAKFPGTPENVVSFFVYVAEQVRHLLSRIGASRLDDVVGRFDLLESREERASIPGLDLQHRLLEPPEGEQRLRVWTSNGPPREYAGLDEIFFQDARRALSGEKVRREYEICNRDRAFGARLSGEIAEATEGVGLPEDTIEATLHGVAGQSFGAFLSPGMSLHLHGDAQDYVGKGLAGGRLTIQAPSDETSSAELHESDERVLAGNVLLYGATAGELFVAGRVGERFCVRNSGARTVVEGCGDHGCEYMTGGVAVVLGEIGRNFGSGMTGGVAFVATSEESARLRIEPEWVEIAAPSSEDLELLRALLERHADSTRSVQARTILADWPAAASRFLRIRPRVDAGRGREIFDAPTASAAADPAIVQRV